MADSVFTKIIKGELPSFKIYEDELTIVILNIHPATTGHALVIPKKQVDKFYDLPEADYSNLMLTVQKVAKKLEHELKPKRVGLKVIGLDVAHAHIHVIPFNNLAEYARVEDQDAPIDSDGLSALAKQLAL